MGRWILVVIVLATAACGASTGSSGTSVGMNEGTPVEPGGTCSERPGGVHCEDGFEPCNVRSEMDGCAYAECVPAGQCNNGNY